MDTDDKDSIQCCPLQRKGLFAREARSHCVHPEHQGPP